MNTQKIQQLNCMDINEPFFVTAEDGKTYQITKTYDPDPFNPRLNDYNLGTMVCWHRRYALGDESNPDIDPNKYIKNLAKKNAIIASIYMYEHSGIALSLTDFNDPWDSGWLGFIYATPKRARKLGINYDEETVTKEFEKELKLYQNFLNGECYAMTIESDDFSETCGDLYSAEDMDIFITETIGNYQILEQALA